MSTWTIYRRNTDPDRNPVASAHELEFHGEWMGDEYVSVTVKSPVPIDFHFGDCLTYRGTRYEIDYDPNFIKKARIGSYGEGFVYENIKLHSISARLKHIGFKDVVLNTLADNANKLVYSSLGTFSFFASSVEDLADRIQANLNRDNGTLWNVFTPDRNRTYQRVDSHVPSTAWGNYYDGNEDKGEKDIDVQASDLSCMDALRLCYNTFGLSFYCIGTLIIIGGKPLTVDYGFEYGKGKGLYEIERTSDDSQKIVTKLFAYGSERNLPINYYAMLHKRAYVTGNRATHRVTRSENEFPYIQTDIPFISVSGKFTGNGTCQVEYGGRTCDGVFADIEEKLWVELTPRGSSYAQSFWDRLGTGSVKVYVNSGVNVNTWPYVENSSSSQSNYPALLSINRLMLPGFPDVSLYDWVISNGGTTVDASTGKATWRGYTAYFSKDKSDPWIKSLFADQLGIREGTVNFDSGDEEIYPTIDGTGFDEVKWSEQIEDNGYLDGDDATFELKPMRVNGDDGEIQWNYSGDTVSISMKDGYCVGREFTVKSARLNDDKEWVLKLERRKDDSLGIYFPYKYGNSELYQIWGRDNRSGSAGDHFVVLGIPLPKSYVDIAAAKLLEESLKHLMEIDRPQYTYIPRIDEIEMARQHDRATASGGSVVSVHDTISAGMQMRVDDNDLSIHYLPFIDTITIKENGNNGIPTYDVVLRDEKELTMMERIQSEIRGSRGTVVAGGISGEYLSRVNDDTAQGFIRFIQGLQISERFTTGLLGEGGVFRKEADGTTYIEADKLYIRMKAYFDNVEIRDYQHSSGNRIATQARGFSCARVEWIDASGNVLEQKEENLPSVQLFRCYWRVDDGEHKNDNQFRIGDLAFCQFSDVSNSSLVINRFWRLVVGRNSGLETTEDGEAWIDLSNAHKSNGAPKKVSFTYTGQGGVQKTMSALSFEPGSGVPTEENDICQLGSVNDRDRQGAIIEFVTGADAPSYQIFQEIGSDASNPYSLHNKNYIALGYSTQTGRAYMNVYGDMFIGEAPDSQGNSRTYIHYYQKEETNPETGQTVVTPTMDIKANVIFQSPDTGEDTSLVDYVNEILSEFQDQIDGVVDTYYMEGTPTMNNKPVTDWIAGVTDEEQKKAIYRQHIGDIYYQMDTGQGFRFLRDEQGNYSWVEISDDALLEALRMAREAADLADSKMRVFVTQPVPPYGLGDLWVNAKYPATVQEGEERLYDDVILRCKTAKDEDGTFDINDWTPAQNYSELYNFIEGQYADDMQKIAGQLDKKAETWYQDTDPSLAWQTQQEDTRSEHVGDIWYDTSANGGNKTYVYQYDSSRNRYYWQETSVPDDVFDRIDGKAEIYVTKPTTYNERDLWIIEQSSATCPDSDIPANCQRGDIVVSSASRVNNYQKSDWTKKDRYTNDDKFDGYINAFLNGTGSSGDAATAAAAQKAIKDALGGATVVDGGLMLTSLIAMRKYNGGDKTQLSSYTTWAGISGQYDANAYGGGIAAWYGGLQADKEVSATNYAKTVFRFDGSGYVAGGNLKWDKDGNVTIQGYDIKVNGESVAVGNLNDYVTIVTDQTITGHKTFGTGNGSYIQIGAIRLVYDQSNNALKVVASDGSSVANFYATGGVSALGIGSGGSSGISIEAVWTALANTDSSKQINISHLTNALSGYNPTNNFKTINGNSIIGTGDITIEGGSGGVDLTAVWTALAANTTQQINATHLTTALSNYLPLTGGTMTNTNRVVNLNADLLDGHHATDFVFGTNGVADSASTLANKTVTAYTLDRLSGSFTFEGYNLTVDVTPQIDEVGIQIGSSADKFQLVCRDYALMIRQNDEGGTDSLNWTQWITLPTKLHTSHQLKKRDQWFRFANLTVYGASYLVSIRDNYYNNAPTPITWIINVGYDSATITQVGRAVLSPTSLTKLRIVRYELDGDYGFHLEVYTPYQRSISMNTPEINIMNLGRDNMSDGVELVHDPDYDTKWLEVDEEIESGELLLEEVGISDSTTLWGQPFDGSSSVSGSMTGVTSIEMNSDGALSGFGGFIDFHYGGSSADYTSRIIENASGRIAINDILYVKTNGTVGIGTDSPSTSYKLDVNGDGRMGHLTIGLDNDNVKGKISPLYFSSSGGGMAEGTAVKITPDLTNTNVWFAFRRAVNSSSQPAAYLYTSIENTVINTLQINKADSTTYNFHVGQGFSSKSGTTILWGYAIDFRTKVGGSTSTTHMSITNAGNVGIGTTSPSYKFQVNGQSYFTGNMGIGVAVSNSYALRVNGIVRASTGVYSEGYVTALSDIRHKDIRGDVGLTVSEVANAPSVKFLWKDRRKEGMQVGSIAQYWQKVLPEAIVEAADGELTMSYGVIALLASIATARKVEDHERRIAELEKENKELREQLKAA